MPSDSSQQIPVERTCWPWHKWGLVLTVCVCVHTHALNRSVMYNSVAIPWSVAHQAPLSMKFSRREYWSGLSFPPTGDLSNPGIKLTSSVSPVLVSRFFNTELPGKPCFNYETVVNKKKEERKGEKQEERRRRKREDKQGVRKWCDNLNCASLQSSKHIWLQIY